MARTMFKSTITDASGIKAPPRIPVATDMRIKSPKKIAIDKFAMMPAEATQSVPLLWSFRLLGLYGTGLAQPIKNGAWVITNNNGRTIEPNKSRCFIGFKVNLPAYWAVLSPNERAAYPWATSCITTDIMRTII